MTFDTYIINLDRDLNHFHILQKKLKTKHIYPIRFKAIYGKDITDYGKYNKYISTYCKYFCTDAMNGCGISHYKLLDDIYKKYNTYNQTVYSLILEDDVSPLFLNKKTIENIIKNIPTDCDILSLYCQGICKYNQSKDTQKKFIKGTKYMGSAAAYIVKNSSIPKINKQKLHHHIDVQRYFNKDITIYVYHTPLFTVDNSTSYNLEVNNKINKLPIVSYVSKLLYLDNISIFEAIMYKIFKIPFINVELTFLSFVLLIITIVICILVYIIKKHVYT